MKSFALKLKKFIRNDDGPTAVEYAIMLSLIAVLTLTAVKTVGQNARDTFNGVADQISADQDK